MKIFTNPIVFVTKSQERGAEKEKKFVMEVIQKKWEEERARIPKANPYPYTTDFPLVRKMLVSFSFKLFK